MRGCRRFSGVPVYVRWVREEGRGEEGGEHRERYVAIPNQISWFLDFNVPSTAQVTSRRTPGQSQQSAIIILEHSGRVKKN